MSESIKQIWGEAGFSESLDASVGEVLISLQVDKSQGRSSRFFLSENKTETFAKVQTSAALSFLRRPPPSFRLTPSLRTHTYPVRTHTYPPGVCRPDSPVSMTF